MARSKSYLTRRQRAGFRPRLESLEDRTVPSTFTVLNTADNGVAGSLRWAVGLANAHPGADTIDFHSGVFSTPRTITLIGGQLNLSDTSGATSIAGPAASLTIDGGYRSRVFQVDPLVTASISGLTITKGVAYGSNGGGLSNSGSLTMTNCTVRGNSAGDGGGVANAGTATLVNCTISGNTGRYNYGYSYGGGMANDGTATLVNCTISGNSVYASSGGGVANFGTATLTNCTVSGNKSTGNGGRVFVGVGASLTLTDSTVSGNTASGSGGGLYLSDSTTVIRNSTIAENTAAKGCGIYGGTQPFVQSTIVANNVSNAGPDLFGSATATFSLIANTANATLGPGSANNLLDRDPLLGPLADNGGPTLTHALLPGSPAINAGSNPANLTMDQRLAGFPRVFGSAVDIGAFEVQQATITSVVVNGGQENLVQRSMVTSLTVAFSGRLTFTGAPAAAFHLVRSGQGGTLEYVTLAVDLSGSTATQTVARLTFSGALTEGPHSLMDGAYTLRIIGTPVNGGLLGAYYVSTLFRLFGDVNGNRTVNAADLTQFRAAFGSGDPTFDVDGNGVVNAFDLAAFRTNFGMAI
jgi:parallel beta-helix repeat protein